jgi:hypothetical protein
VLGSPRLVVAVHLLNLVGRSDERFTECPNVYRAAERELRATLVIHDLDMSRDNTLMRGMLARASRVWRMVVVVMALPAPSRCPIGQIAHRRPASFVAHVSDGEFDGGGDAAAPVEDRHRDGRFAALEFWVSMISESLRRRTSGEVMVWGVNAGNPAAMTWSMTYGGE